MSPKPHQPATTPARKQAVAMRYNQAQDSAPRILAKGQGTIAERILALAEEHSIPLHRDDDLVTLLSVLEVDAEIPPRLYHAMAEILAHIYRMNHRG